MADSAHVWLDIWTNGYGHWHFEQPQPKWTQSWSIWHSSIEHNGGDGGIVGLGLGLGVTGKTDVVIVDDNGNVDIGNDDDCNRDENGKKVVTSVLRYDDENTENWSVELSNKRDGDGDMMNEGEGDGNTEGDGVICCSVMQSYDSFSCDGIQVVFMGQL